MEVDGMGVDIRRPDITARRETAVKHIKAVWKRAKNCPFKAVI
jgi:hypothetical protein